MNVILELSLFIVINEWQFVFFTYKQEFIKSAWHSLYSTSLRINVIG